MQTREEVEVKGSVREMVEFPATHPNYAPGAHYKELAQGVLASRLLAKMATLTVSYVLFQFVLYCV